MEEKRNLEQSAQQRAYLMYSWFDQKQTDFMNTGLEVLKGNPTLDFENSFKPLDGQYGDLNVEEHPEVMENVEWQLGTFRNDYMDMCSADIGVALYLPDDSDEGIAWELGFLFAMHKVTVLVIPDDQQGVPINLMTAIGITRIITLSEAKTFNFNHIVYKPYHGKVF